MSEKLLPCPFCGGTEVELKNTHTASFWVECSSCGCEISGEHFDGPRRDDRFSYSEQPQGKFEAKLEELHPEYKRAALSAIARWNSRAAPLAQAPVALLEGPKNGILVEPDDMRFLMQQAGIGEGYDEGDAAGIVLWIGETIDRDGDMEIRTYGLQAYNVEVPEEGSVCIVELERPTPISAKEEGRPVLPHRSGGGLTPAASDSGHMQIAMQRATAASEEPGS